jgi:hypothetical protein
MENQKEEEKKGLTLEEKNKLVTKEHEEIRKKYNLDVHVTIHFPDYRRFPDDLQLALNVISKHNMQFIISYTERKQDDNKS